MSTPGVVEHEVEQVFGFEEFEIDFIDEIRLRTWARRNYVPQCERNEEWHPVILHEMQRIDAEV